MDRKLIIKKLLSDASVFLLAFPDILRHKTSLSFYDILFNNLMHYLKNILKAFLIFKGVKLKKNEDIVGLLNKCNRFKEFKKIKLNIKSIVKKDIVYIHKKCMDIFFLVNC